MCNRYTGSPKSQRQILRVKALESIARAWTRLGSPQHFAIETGDAEAMRAYLAYKGVHVPDHVPKGRIGNLNFMIKDPEGHNVEVVQYSPDALTARAYGKNIPDTRISKRMVHVGFVVTNYDAEMKFYTEVLGFRDNQRSALRNARFSEHSY